MDRRDIQSATPARLNVEERGCTLEIDADGIALITLDLPGKVNVMNDDFIFVMDGFVRRLESEAHLRGVIMTSAKRTFIAGGDLALMGQARKGQEQKLFSHFETLKGLLRRLEKLQRPVVAAINGTALGGGLELALACSHRIALRRDDIVVGLPEVGFGILPGAGGVVRLTGLIGLDEALDYLLSGKKVGVEVALADGIIDDLAESDSALLKQARAWIVDHPRPIQPWDSPRGESSQSTSEMRRVEPVSEVARRIFEVASQSTTLDVDTALRAETSALIELMVRPETAVLIASFFESRRPARAVRV